MLQRKELDRMLMFNYIHPMFTQTTVTIMAARKAAWHADAVAEGDSIH